MRRGAIYAISGRGDFSTKPRPAVIVQSDLFTEHHLSLTVCPISASLTGDHLFRVAIDRNPLNGLDRDSEVEVDKVQSVWRARFGQRIGETSEAVMVQIDDALRRWLSL